MGGRRRPKRGHPCRGSPPERRLPRCPSSVGASSSPNAQIDPNPRLLWWRIRCARRRARPPRSGSRGSRLPWPRQGRCGRHLHRGWPARLGRRRPPLQAGLTRPRTSASTSQRDLPLPQHGWCDFGRPLPQLASGGRTGPADSDGDWLQE